jgi:hypothetical protein
MMRNAAALAIVVVAAFALHRIVIVRWHCNNIEGAVNRATDAPLVRSDDYRVRQAAERNVALATECLDRCKTDVNLAVLTAANFMMLGRDDAAVPLYERALKYDQRPEIYFALAAAQSNLGMREAALQNAVAGADFAGLDGLAEIPDGTLRWRAHEIVGTRLERYRARSGAPPRRNVIVNGEFDEPGPRGPSVHIDGYAYVPSAAAQWELVNPYGSTTTTLVPSQRRPGGKAIRVTTTRELSGLRQRWPKTKPKGRVLTTVWVFVHRGRVSIGSGTGLGPMQNAFSTSTGRWEKLEATNEVCPATTTQVQAADGGADFIIDEVTVRETMAAPPCDS